MKAFLLCLWAVVGAGCLKAVPTPMTGPSNLGPVQAPGALEELKHITLGPQGRFAMLGEFFISPEAMGVDIGSILGEETSGLQGGTVWCVEPISWVGESLVLAVGMTWWPPRSAPNGATPDIATGLMRCLGLVAQKPWSRATVYLAPGAVPRVESAGQRPPLIDGIQTLEAALEQAFLFGVAAPFHARGLALGATGAQDGFFEDEERGLRRRAEAHILVDDTLWKVSHRMTYSATEQAGKFSLMGAGSVATVLDGASYVVGEGVVGELVPRKLVRAALRVRTGLQTRFLSMTARARAEYSPGLSCVLRTLSKPETRGMYYGEMSTPGTGDDSDEALALANSVDGGVVVERKYPGVDLESALKCTLSDEDQEGPRRIMK